MNIGNFQFPVVIRNNLKTWCVVGRIWFPPDGSLSVSRHFFEEHVEEIKASIEEGRLTILSDVTEEDETDEVKVLTDDSDKEEAEDDNIDTRSIVDKYVEEKTHWKTVTKEIEEVTDLHEAEGLLVDAQFHELPEDGAIMKAILSKIEELDK